MLADISDPETSPVEVTITAPPATDWGTLLTWALVIGVGYYLAKEAKFV